MKRLAPLSLFVTALALALTLSFAFNAGAKPKTEASAPEIGEAAPEFTLSTVTGEEVSLSDYQGKVVVIHFQSMQCPWDLGYQPILTKMASDHAASDEDAATAAVSGDDAGEMAVDIEEEAAEETTPEVVFLAINSNKSESSEDLAAYHQEKGMSYPILKDEGNVVADKYAAQTTPHMYIIDTQGVLRYMGGVEEAPRSPDGIGQSDQQHFASALEAVVTGSDVEPSVTKPKGCSIKRVK